MLGFMWMDLSRLGSLVVVRLVMQTQDGAIGFLY